MNRYILFSLIVCSYYQVNCLSVILSCQKKANENEVLDYDESYDNAKYDDDDEEDEYNYDHDYDHHYHHWVLDDDHHHGHHDDHDEGDSNFLSLLYSFLTQIYAFWFFIKMRRQ